MIDRERQIERDQRADEDQRLLHGARSERGRVQPAARGHGSHRHADEPHPDGEDPVTRLDGAHEVSRPLGVLAPRTRARELAIERGREAEVEGHEDGLDRRGQSGQAIGLDPQQTDVEGGHAEDDQATRHPADDVGGHVPLEARTAGRSRVGGLAGARSPPAVLTPAARRRSAGSRRHPFDRLGGHPGVQRERHELVRGPLGHREVPAPERLQDGSGAPARSGCRSRSRAPSGAR